MKTLYCILFLLFFFGSCNNINNNENRNKSDSCIEIRKGNETKKHEDSLDKNISVSSNEVSYKGQINSNDSLSIYRTLKDTTKDYWFGNKVNGVYRSYRFIKGMWSLILIQYFNNGRILWSQIPFDFENEEFFEIAWLYHVDSLDAIIPFENGKKWQIFSVRKNRLVGEMTTYYRNGKIREVIDYDNNTFTEYNKIGICAVKIIGGSIIDRYNCYDCEMNLYDNMGNLKFQVNAHSIVMDNKRQYANIYNGTIKDIESDTVYSLGESHKTIYLK